MSVCYSFDPRVTFNLSVWSVFLSLCLIVLSVWSHLLLPGCYLFDPGVRSQVTPTARAWHCLTGTEQRPESLSVSCVSSAIIWPRRICWDTPITEYQYLIEQIWISRYPFEYTLYIIQRQIKWETAVIHLFPGIWHWHWQEQSNGQSLSLSIHPHETYPRCIWVR